MLADEKILLTVKEFARVSGLGETCARNLVQTEGFPVLRNGRKYMIHRRAADKRQVMLPLSPHAQAL